MSIINGNASTTVTYHITCEQIKQLIAQDLGVSAEKLKVTYKLKAEADDMPCANVSYCVDSIEVVMKQ